MKNYYYIPLLIFLVVGNLNGQFDPITNYHNQNPFFYNPAMAGIENTKKLHIGASFRSPADHGTLSYEHPLENYNSNIGIYSRTFLDYYTITHKVGLAYNYTFRLGQKVSISPGFQFTNISMDSRPDKISFSTIKSNWISFPNFDFGLVVQLQNLKLGASIIDSRNTSKRFQTVYSTFYTPETYRTRTWVGTVSYDLKLPYKWAINASMLVYDYFEKKGDKIYDWSLLFNHNENIFVGMAYRKNDQIDEDFKFRLFLGTKLWKKLSIFVSTNFDKDGKRYRIVEPMIQYIF